MCNYDDKLMVYLNLEYFNPFFCDQNLHSKWCSIICKREQYTTMLPCECSTSNTGSSNLSIKSWKWGKLCAPCMTELCTFWETILEHKNSSLHDRVILHNYFQWHLIYCDLTSLIWQMKSLIIVYATNITIVTVTGVVFWGSAGE